MKKILVSALLLVTMIFNMLVMASCSGDDSGLNLGDITGALDKVGYPVPAEGYDGSEVTITFYHTMSQTTLQPVLEAAIVEFNKLYPNIHIEHTAVGGYDDVVDKIKTELTAGNQPNIAYCYPDHVALYNIARAVVPLDNFIDSTITITDATGKTSILGLENKSDFVEAYYKEGAVYDKAGTMYTMPLSKSTEALFFNKSFFENCRKIYASDVELDLNGNTVYDVDDNGTPEDETDDIYNTRPNPHKGDENYNISVPTDRALSWDEIEALCAKILAVDPNCIPLGYDSESNWFITMCEQLKSGYTTVDTSNHFLFDNEENREFVEKFAEWYKKGYVTTKELYGAYTSNLFKEIDASKQKCYLVIGSTGGANNQVAPKDGNGNYVFECAIAPIPQASSNPEEHKAISQGPSLCIFKDSNPQEVVASWLFVKYLTTNIAFQAQFSIKSGYAPVIKSVNQNPTYAQWLAKADGYGNLTASSVKFAIEQGDICYVSPAFNGSSAARLQVGLIIQNVFAAAKAGNNIKDAIDQEFKLAINECKHSIGAK